MEFSLIIPAFIAGVITFLAPCTLPLLPGYLAFISGDVEGGEKVKRRSVFLSGVFFVLGFSLVFITFGVLIGFLGESLAPIRLWMSRIGGIFVILFGLWMMRIFKLSFLNFLGKEKKFKVPMGNIKSKNLSALVLGLSFGTGWTPCVGPILASILLLAATGSTAIGGGFLLLVFSLGLGIPFLLVAASVARAEKFIKRFSKYLRWVEFVGGIFLVLLGILLLTDNFVQLINWGFRLLEFINYSEIIKFL